MRRPPSSLLILAIFPALLWGCSLNSSRESEQDRSIALLNQRNYGQAITDLEKSLAATPEDHTKALMLSMAYLGQGNAEMLDYLQRLLGRQTVSPEVYSMKFKCGQEEWDKDNLREKPVSCILYRMMSQTTPDENPDVYRAEQLLLAHFRDPRSTSQEVNFLIAYVEIYRAFNRARIVSDARAYDASSAIANERGVVDLAVTNQLFGFTVRNLKGVFSHLMETLRRLKYSYSKLAQHTKSLDGKPLVQHKKRVLLFDDNLTPEIIVKFWQDVLYDEFTDAKEEQINDRLSGSLSKLAPKLFRSGKILGFLSNRSGAADKLQLSWRFSHSLEKFFRNFNRTRFPSNEPEVVTSDETDKIMQQIWNSPPGIFGDLARVLRASWKEEKIDVLVDFDAKTRPIWRELEALLQRADKISKVEEVAKMQAYLAELLYQRRMKDPNYLAPPVQLGREEIVEYLRAVTAEIDMVLKQYREGRLPDAPPLSEGSRKEITSIWLDARAWIIRNVIDYQQN